MFPLQKIKNRVSSRLLAKIRVSQVFWEPIKNSASPRSALPKAMYLEALLYFQKLRNDYLYSVIHGSCEEVAQQMTFEKDVSKHADIAPIQMTKEDIFEIAKKIRPSIKKSMHYVKMIPS